MDTTVRLSALVRLFLAFALFLGCGSRERPVRVGSKEFTEQLLLGQITLQVLQEAGYPVEDATGIAGSNKLRTALLGRDIDVYWEYTGTAWISHLQHDRPLTRAEECYRQVRDEDARNGVAWLRFAPFNNTYTIMMRAAQARSLGIGTLSQLGAYLAAHPGRLTFAMDHEFAARPDGLPGLSSTYGFRLDDNQVLIMDNAIVYKALKENQADIGMGFSTDARIQAYGLMSLEDDQTFFPVYNPAPNLRVDYAKSHPRVVALLEGVAARLDDRAIIRMNYQVDIEGRLPKDVAGQWLKDSGLLKK